MGKPSKKKSYVKLIVIASVVLLLMIAGTVILMPYIRKLGDPVVQEEFKKWLNSLGILGYLVIITIQIVQIVIAFIPGEPVEVLAGVMYGGLGGLLICLIGCVIASTGVFLLSKKLGTAFTEKMFDKEHLDKFTFLKDSRKLEMVVFVLFLIPGTPKDMLTYIVGTTPMRLFQFLLISTVARIPSIISSTLIGSSIRNCQWGLMILIFALTAAVGVLGIIYKDKFAEFYQKIGRHMKDGKAEEE
jgi:uncharacterized membrane protein YdjX (TVP38/TMEM64 family)